MFIPSRVDTKNLVPQGNLYEVLALAGGSILSNYGQANYIKNMPRVLGFLWCQGQNTDAYLI